jgi:hypothetical protein
MRKLYWLTALLLPVTPGVAQTPPSCQQMVVAIDRLACYDNLFPPLKPTQAQADKNRSRAASESIAEDERVKKALRPICKNC